MTSFISDKLIIIIIKSLNISLIGGIFGLYIHLLNIEVFMVSKLMASKKFSINICTFCSLNLFLEKILLTLTFFQNKSMFEHSHNL